MSIAEEVARLEEENARLRAALKQVVSAIEGAGAALAGETPEPVAVPLPPVESTPEPEKVEKKGVPGGAYKVSAADVMAGRML